MTDTDRSELPRWFRGPVTNSERLNIGKTAEEIAEDIQQRISEAQANSEYLKKRRKTREITEDEYLLDVATGDPEDRRSYPYQNYPAHTDLPEIRRD